MNKLKKSILFLTMAVVTAITPFAGVSASKNKTACYPGDFRLWNQGESAYSEMREVGCLITAQAKMLYEAGINRGGINPDTWYEWLWGNGYLAGPPTNLNMLYFDGPVKYAGTQGASLTYFGDDWDNSDWQIKWNCSVGYFTIVNVGNHFVLVDNETTNRTGTVYIYDSYNNPGNVDSSWPVYNQYTWNGGPRPISKYSTRNKIYVYKVNSVHTHSYSASVTKQATCTEAGVRTYKCSCGHSYTEQIAAKGHNYKNTIVAPTLSDKGYTLHTCSNCGYSYKDTYVDAPILNEDGYFHCYTLPAGIDSNEYIIEYNNYYEKVQKDSPGADWNKTSTVKNEWQNSGTMYSSESDLPTSDTRVFVKTIYYHFCGPNAGRVGNYAQTGNFVHYDEIDTSRYGIIAKYCGDDEGHPYYLLDWNDGGGRVYCSSGVTCDGSYGTHGERCQVWYKLNFYQNRVKVEQYKYTKYSGWTLSKDSSANKTEIRFKKIEEEKKEADDNATDDNATDFGDAIDKNTSEDINDDTTKDSLDDISEDGKEDMSEDDKKDDIEDAVEDVKRDDIEYAEKDEKKAGTEDIVKDAAEEVRRNVEKDTEDVKQDDTEDAANNVKKDKTEDAKKDVKNAKDIKVPDYSVKGFKAKAGKKKIILSWKMNYEVSGYQIQISTKKNFKNAKKRNLSYADNRYTFNKLKAKKKYYIRIRSMHYEYVNGAEKKVYGKWKTISKKTKR